MKDCNSRYCRYCEKSHDRSLWCHSDCRSLLNSSYDAKFRPSRKELQRFGRLTQPKSNNRQATTSTSDKLAIIEGLLSPHTQRILNGIAAEALPSARQSPRSSFTESLQNLPLEIFSMVASYIGPCRFLIVLGQARRLIDLVRHQASSDEVTMPIYLTSPIYISRTVFRNQSYITRIRNSPDDSGSSDEQILDLDDNTGRIVISTDDLGLRNVRFFKQPSSNILGDGSPWYHVLDITDLQTTLLGISDVSHPLVLVTGLTDRPGPHSTSTITCWRSSDPTSNGGVGYPEPTKNSTDQILLVENKA